MIRRGIGVQSFVSAGVPTDADAQAFITAAGITDATQQSAINTLVTDLKGYGIWTKMKAIYPFVGGTSSTHKWNLKDPRDLDAAFRLVFSGGITHSSTGVLFNGINGIGDTKFIPSSQYTNNLSASMGFYSPTLAGNTQISMGGDSAGTGFNLMNKFYNVGNNYIGRAFIREIIPATQLSNTGFTYISRNGDTSLKLYFDGVSVFQNTTSESSTSRPTVSVYLGGLNGGTQRTSQEFSFAFIGDALNDTEAANFYTAVQAYQTTLSRNV